MKTTQETPNRLPVIADDSFELDREVRRVWEWSKINPVKASAIGIFGFMGLRSPLLRSLVLMTATSAGTLFVRKKLAKSEILH